MNLNRRNYPPEHGIRIPEAQLQSLVAALLRATGMAPADADLLGTILTRNNRRCLYSHGTGQVPYYLERLREGDVNPAPRVSVVHEAAASMVLDGDGGFGYFPCHQGTLRLIEKAKSGGIAALTSSNHHHIGAVGNYTRLALEHDCIALGGSSYRNHLQPETMIYSLLDASPLSIAIPAGQQPPLVMDMGTAMLPFNEALFEQQPTTYLKILALVAAVKGLCGVFPGVFRQALADSPWQANQSAFIAVVDVAHFLPVDELKAEMDRYIGEARAARPLPGMPTAQLAGGNEWAWDRNNEANGIPLSDEHIAALQAEADALGVDTPFARLESTRF